MGRVFVMKKGKRRMKAFSPFRDGLSGESRKKAGQRDGPGARRGRRNGV